MWHMVLTMEIEEKDYLQVFKLTKTPTGQHIVHEQEQPPYRDVYKRQVEGKFVKEEYSDHMKRNQRYYKWISKDDENHLIYVNFAEEEPNVFTVSAYNTSGFSGTEAIEKYLDTVKALSLIHI